MQKTKAKCVRVICSAVQAFRGLCGSSHICIPQASRLSGFGCTRYPDGVKSPLLQDKPITEACRRELLRVMPQRFQDGVLASCRLSNPCIAQPRVLIWHTNIGLNAFSSSTLRKVINDGGDNAAISAQFRRWNKSWRRSIGRANKTKREEIAPV